ncbi:uncharacterized protein [Miscanthus floridulus]|uniref:uncharacterized protein n=1 Tax=Miscanthus floridulus TaxID=154761 RepID=UPI00345934B5
MGIVCLHATLPFLSMIWMAHLLSPHALAIPASVISWAALSLPSGVAQIHALPAVDAYPLSVLLTAYSCPFLSISFPLRLLYLDARPRRFHWRCGDCSGEVVLPRFRVLAKKEFSSPSYSCLKNVQWPNQSLVHVRGRWH